MRFKPASQSSLSGQASNGRTSSAGTQSGADEPLREESRAMKVTDAREMRQRIKVIALLRKSMVYMCTALKGESGGVEEGMSGGDGLA